MAEETSPWPAPSPAPAAIVPTKTPEQLAAERQAQLEHRYGTWGTWIIEKATRAGNTISALAESGGRLIAFIVGQIPLLLARFWRVFTWGERKLDVQGNETNERNPLLTESAYATGLKLGLLLTFFFAMFFWIWSRTFTFALGEEELAAVVMLALIGSFGEISIDRLIALKDTLASMTMLPSPGIKEQPRYPIIRTFWLKRIENPIRRWLKIDERPLEPSSTPEQMWHLTVSQLTVGGNSYADQLGRIFLVLVLSVVNAIPLELSFLRQEIEARIGQEELATQTRIRETAEQRAHARANARRAQENTRYHGELESYNADRETQRVEVVRQHNTELARRRAAITTLEQQAIDETRNGGVDENGRRRPPGPGPSFNSVRGHASDDRADLERYETRVRQEQEAFTAATTAHRSQLLAQNTTNLETIRMDEERDIASTQSPQFLAEHESEWKQPRGFLSRFMILLKLEGEDKVARLVIWGSRIIIVAMGMIFLLIKRLFPREFVLYNSCTHQAALGHPMAIAQLKSLGINNPEAYAQNPSVKAANAIWSWLYAKANAEVNLLEKRKSELARAKLRSGLHHDIAWIRNTLKQRSYEKIFPILVDMKRFADFAANNGITLKHAESFFFQGRNPESLNETLWMVTSTDLTELGWKDPTPAREDLDEKLARYADLQMILLGRLSDWMFQLMEFSTRKTPGYEISVKGQQAYRTLQPDLLEMARLEALFTKRAEPTPPWGKDGDPREELKRRMIGRGPLDWLMANTTWKDPTPEGEQELLEEPDPDTVTNGSGEHLIARQRQTPPPLPPAAKAQTQESR